MWRIVLGLTILHFAQARVFDNPLLNEDASYPSITKYKDVYYAVSSPGGIIADLYVSTDLQNWTYRGNIMNQDNYPTWAIQYGFAPSQIQASVEYFLYYYEVSGPTVVRLDRPARYKIMKIGPVVPKLMCWNVYPDFALHIKVINDNNFRFFFQVFTNGTYQYAVAAATAMNIEGPYYVLDKPMIHNPNHFYGRPSMMNSNGALYLLWTSLYYGQIFSRRLKPDGIGFADKTNTTLLHQEEIWEGGYLKGAYAFKRENYHYIFYGGNDYCSGNGIGVARSKYATGPYEKFSGNPFLVSTDMTGVVGQPNVVEDIDGSDVIIFQTSMKTSLTCGSPRMSAATLNWDDDGWPYVNDFSVPKLN